MGNDRFSRSLAGLSALLVFTLLVRWAGLPSRDLPLFVLGVVSVVVVLSALAFIAWYLLLRPLHEVAPSDRRLLLSAGQRQGLASLLTISGIMIVVGGFWDEVWHRNYGIPFGEDLFWRPHLLLYAGLLLVSAAAAAAVLLMWRKGQGDWPERFHADPYLGWLVLVGAFLAYAVPADPAWHALYGADISAWSVPHLILMASFISIMVLAAALQYSVVSTRPWRIVQALSVAELLMIVALAFGLMVGLQLLTTEWDGLTRVWRGSPDPFWQRPEWLLPVVVLGLAVFFGSLANGWLRYAGAATLLGLVSFAGRYLLTAIFGEASMSANAWLLALPPLIGLDVWYAVRLRLTGEAPAPIGLAFGATIGMAAGTLPLIGILYVYPQLSTTTVVPMLGYGFLTALWACWLGVRAGQALGYRGAGDQVARAEVIRAATGATAALVLATGFIAWFIVTAGVPA